MKQWSQISKVIFAALLYLLLISCSGEKTYVRDVYPDGKYDSQFPFGESSQHLKEITKSVKLINSLAFYKQYQFSWSQNITTDSLQNPALLSKAYGTLTSNKSASGTGTIIGSNSDKIIFLTTAHIVNFADTIISYYSNDRGQLTSTVESISIKQSQTNYVALMGLGNMEIVMLDKARDIALMGGSIDDSFPRNFSVFGYRLGDSRELEWGNFIYAFGYPMHFRMLTHGLVSLPEDDEDYFVTNINVNRGSSGGPVLALRDGIPNFELVGIVSSMPAEKTNILIPKPLINNTQYRLEAKYEGDVYISEVESTKYGIAKVITIRSIIKSLEENRELLINSGYNLSLFEDILYKN